MAQGSVFAAIVGKPNVGKSTLLNRMTGAKIAIVSSKPQTTRTRITGVLTRGETQFVFMDTPGFHKPRTKLGEKMVKSVADTVSEVDAALFLTYPKDYFDDSEQSLLSSLGAAGIPVILVINKADTAQSKKKLAEYRQKLGELFTFSAAVCTNALDGENVDGLLDILAGYATPGPHFFPDDTLTDQPERVIAGEIIREKLLNGLYDELPHGCGVSVESYKPREGTGLVDINAVIFCERESHKGMIIGKGGGMLKSIATAARLDIEDFLGQRVNLQIRVKTKQDWRNNEAVIKYLGY